MRLDCRFFHQPDQQPGWTDVSTGALTETTCRHLRDSVVSQESRIEWQLMLPQHPQPPAVGPRAAELDGEAHPAPQTYDRGYHITKTWETYELHRLRTFLARLQ